MASTWPSESLRVSRSAFVSFRPQEMATKELQNGRLAMIAVAGFFLQELVNGKGIIENFSA